MSMRLTPRMNIAIRTADVIAVLHPDSYSGWSEIALRLSSQAILRGNHAAQDPEPPRHLFVRL
jgi:hypothetical protein